MVIKHKCSNGVRVLLEKMPFVRSASIGIWIGTGSRYENESNNGISHFIEHMLFKGTEKRSAREIAEAFDRIGGQVNAFTSKECTCFYAKVMDSDASYAVHVLADMLFHSRFDSADLEKEKQVIGEEIKMYEDTPDDLVHDLLSAASFAHHPLGYPILGTKQTLADFNRDDLKSHMHTHYTPDNIVVSAAGNLDESFTDEIDRIFADYRVPESEERQPAPSFSPGKIARKKETEQAHICLGYAGVSSSDEKMVPLMVMNNALGGSMSSRLFQNIREDRGLAYSVFSFHTAFKDSGLLTVYAGTGADQIEELGQTILETIRTMTKEGLTEKELDSSKAQIKGNIILGLESTNSRMSRNAKNELILGHDRPIDEMINQIDAVTLDDVHDVAESIFDKPYSCSIVSPTGKMPAAL
ncbi:pitrilysin family protein [Sporolactobacillus sp. CQH2019]|uniref:M16 family metallopeptidase n=1 Tax=Sporolactobacillus sp. CQH2019 TaxID=3023512 RepID=UPI002368D12F|nr:pitrilysin family protein [Sporolactobacillus sp. CQH2019]MDD9147017.1 pitrilysin family protein [Sporolactobacillus sp. CQH2019]